MSLVMKNKAETLNQIVAELELFACYRCTHDASGIPFGRSVDEQECLCQSCFIHELDVRMKAVEFYPLEGFDRTIAKLHRTSWRERKV